jgi:tRNA(His) guanylyltransferase
MHLACQVSEHKDSQDTGDLPDLLTVAASEIAQTSPKASQSEKPKMTIEVLHCDIIGNEFWDARPHLFAR